MKELEEALKKGIDPDELAEAISYEIIHCSRRLRERMDIVRSINQIRRDNRVEETEEVSDDEKEEVKGTKRELVDLTLFRDMGEFGVMRYCLDKGKEYISEHKENPDDYAYDVFKKFE